MVDAVEIKQAWDTYRSALERMAELDNGRGEIRSVSEHNRLVNEMRAQRSVLRSSEAGRTAIVSLLTDSRLVVRLWAAGDALAWEEQSARPVLEALRDSADVGLHAVSAKYTLIEFEAGRLG